MNTLANRIAADGENLVEKRGEALPALVVLAIHFEEVVKTFWPEFGGQRAQDPLDLFLGVVGSGDEERLAVAAVAENFRAVAGVDTAEGTPRFLEIVMRREAQRFGVGHGSLDELARTGGVYRDPDFLRDHFVQRVGPVDRRHLGVKRVFHSKAVKIDEEDAGLQPTGVVGAGDHDRGRKSFGL